MPITSWFTFLMKNEPLPNVQNIQWVMDERKCLNTKEIKKLRKICTTARAYGLRCEKFTPVRNWFMIELGLNTGLRVEEMASLKHCDLIIDSDRSSIVVLGKGNKKRAVWINADFKRKCQMYLGYKERFGYRLEEDSYLLNNLKGVKISKRALQKFFKNHHGQGGTARSFSHPLPETHIHDLSSDSEQLQLPVCPGAVGAFIDKNHAGIRVDCRIGREKSN